ncbi:MAG: hypothetical protein HQK83_06350 [Fibrobacteria bacterium]|nr:hypothetical protein [Fibrobacteria bacterium]
MRNTIIATAFLKKSAWGYRAGMFFLLLGFPVFLHSQTLQQDSLILVAFYNETGGADWTSNTNWLSTEPLSSWEGIAADVNHVTEIDLYDNNLVGTIPAELGNLTGLTYLDISINSLTDTIPFELGNLNNLEELNLASNQLTGRIPLALCSLSTLRHLDLSENKLTGTIPAGLDNLRELISLYVNLNQLSGDVPVILNNLSKLRFLGLHSNQLTNLPDLSGLTILVRLDAQKNLFTFAGIEPNIGVPQNSFYYSPQDSVGDERDTTTYIDSTISLSVSVGGTSNVYQWLHNGDTIPGAVEASYSINTVKYPDSGAYVCEITNTVATELTLYSRPVTVHVKEQPLIAPGLLFPDSNAVVAENFTNLIWKKSINVPLYRLRIGTEADIASSLVLDTGGLTDTVFTVTGLEDNTDYYWQVFPVDAQGDGNSSEIRKFTVNLPAGIVQKTTPGRFRLTGKMIEYFQPRSCFVSIDLYSTQGQQVFSIRRMVMSGYARHELPKHLPAGLYHLRFHTDDRKREQSLIILY